MTQLETMLLQRLQQLSEQHEALVFELSEQLKSLSTQLVRQSDSQSSLIKCVGELIMRLDSDSEIEP